MTRNSTRSSRLAVAATAILLPLLLAGCAENDEARRITFATWKQMDPIPQPRLAQTPVHHSVALTPSGEISELEREALEIFLRRNGVAPGSRVTLSAPLPADGNAEALGRRLIAVRKAMADLGVSAATLPPGTGAGSQLPAGSVMVTGHVLAVVQPSCAGYNTPIQLDLEHRPVIEPGCSTAVNLGLMLANPADLQNGQPLSPADGEATTPAIQRYRADQVWPESPPPSAVPFGTDTTASD
jgi:pilus biogenesis lipoprotein CpaD